MKCFARFCFVKKTSADKMILQIFAIFSHEFSRFSNPIEFLGLSKVNWVEKRLKSDLKMSKICEIILSTDIFTTKQNLRKHSTVHWHQIVNNDFIHDFSKWFFGRESLKYHDTYITSKGRNVNLPLSNLNMVMILT